MANLTRGVRGTRVSGRAFQLGGRETGGDARGELAGGREERAGRVHRRDMYGQRGRQRGGGDEAACLLGKGGLGSRGQPQGLAAGRRGSKKQADGHDLDLHWW